MSNTLQKNHAKNMEDILEAKRLRYGKKLKKTMSDTPETDACKSAARGESIFDLCERLERERDEARAELADHKSALEIANRSADDQMRQKRLAERERDEWKKAAFEITEELERERDEARKKLEEEMKWHHRTHQELVETQCKLLDIEYDKLKS